MAWQPMNTAPRDGTPILVFRDNGCGFDYYTVWWSKTDTEYPWHTETLHAYPADRFDGWCAIEPPFQALGTGEPRE